MNITIENSPEIINKWIEDTPPYDDKYKGRGIVMVAGGNKYYINAYVSIRLLREKGCTIPIEVWKLNDGESRPIIESELEKYGVEIIDASFVNSRLEQPHINLNGWECKPFAVKHSKFEDVLFLDADVFCDRDPEYIFNSHEYNKCGSIFMPDFNQLQAWRSFWKVFDLPYKKEQEFESGIIYINKKKCWKALNLTNKICEYGTSFYFDHMHGDKEAWHAALAKTETPYYQVETRIKKLRGTMVQHWKGEPVFYHRNMKKLDLEHNETIKDFKNEELMFAYLEDLKALWNPFYAVGDGIWGKFHYIRYGHDSRMMEIQNHNITKNSDRMEKYVSVINGILYLYDDKGEITATFEKWEDGWIGRWLNFEKCITILEER